MGTPTATLGLVESERTRNLIWFSSQGCVDRSGARVSVWVGGSLVGVYDPEDSGARNVLAVGLALDAKVHLGRLAEAFGVTSETLRVLRHLRQTEGVEALVQRHRGGANRVKVTPQRRAKIEAMFERGSSINEVLARVGSRWSLGRSTVGEVRSAWSARRAPAASPVVPATETARQGELPLVPVTSAAPAREVSPVAVTPPASEASSGAAAPLAVSADTASAAPTSSGSTDEQAGSDEVIRAREPSSGRSVQHAGTWVLLAMVSSLGLHAAAEQHRATRVAAEALRLSLDALIMALAIGEGCVEGVRRLATPSAPALLRAARAPAATWVRRVLGRFAREGASANLHLAMAGRWMRAAAEGEQEAAVFYVDNHLRQYTGQAVIRRGWRMQDKKVVPGASDFYIHDEDARPLLRITAPENPPLTDILSRTATLLRAALGDTQRILLAFDRGGSFPEQMVSLRDEGFEFVTYERRPYALIAPGAFDEEAVVDGETLSYKDTRKNLRAGRGRVRRIAVRTAEGRQINLLAVSALPAPRLIEIMRGRWGQENAFKHGAERWGINQLDGRVTEPFAPESIVPNPARRRLDHALRIARAREGQSRVTLARLAADDPKRGKVESDLADAMAQQEEVLAQRPSTPTKIVLSESELADGLVHHTIEYKLLIDTVRIACTNAESELAGRVGAHLRKPAEAKRVLRNLFMAPGRVRVGSRTLAVDLAPATTATEHEALAALLTEVNRMGLTMPGDPRGRRVRFRLQT